jgi:CBS domain-containing protein/gamma-glutamyl:cysteine ligase YbdK (ATP-grasp superfamily)
MDDAKELIMDDTRDHKTTTGELLGDERRRFMRTLLTDLRALERMLAEGMFERGVSRIGSEQELFFVDRSYQAAPAALDVLRRLDDPHYTTELGLFNLELNADPQPFAGKGLAQMEAQLVELYAKVQRTAANFDAQPVLTGILPTLGKTDLRLANLVPNARYLTLNRMMTAARGEGYDISIKGLDELVAKHDSLMFAACNASFQVHLQVADPERFGHAYDIAQLLLAPVLAVGTNSPTLFGKRLWAETRIALFEQACDIRTPSIHARERAARASFGKGWVKGSVVEIFKDNVTRFRPLVGADHEEDALEVLDSGRVPELKALRLHNGTIYRWNRACYGISENGKPHLRIELRVLPSGPTIVDEVANAAFWLGLMSELSATLEDMPARMDFDHAQANFYAAARDGLAARFTWLDGEEVVAQPFILDKLLPLAESGLTRANVDAEDAKKYLGIIEERVRTQRTGSRWMLHSLNSMMKARGSQGERQTALVAATIARQAGGRPVAEWERARLDEIYGGRTGDNRVSQYMQTDLLTVQPDDPVELAADLMSWERVRHVPVEDASGKLVGLVTSRAVVRHFASLAKKRSGSSSTDLSAVAEEPSIAVSDIMRSNLLTVSPDTLTVDAIAMMRQQRVGCLPVVEDGHIVALITEEDFMGIAAGFHDKRIGDVDPTQEYSESRKRP